MVKGNNKDIATKFLTFSACVATFNGIICKCLLYFFSVSPFIEKIWQRFISHHLSSHRICLYHIALFLPADVWLKWVAPAVAGAGEEAADIYRLMFSACVLGWANVSEKE